MSHEIDFQEIPVAWQDLWVEWSVRSVPWLRVTDQLLFTAARLAEDLASPSRAVEAEPMVGPVVEPVDLSDFVEARLPEWLENQLGTDKTVVERIDLAACEASVLLAGAGGGGQASFSLRVAAECETMLSPDEIVECTMEYTVTCTAGGSIDVALAGAAGHAKHEHEKQAAKLRQVVRELLVPGLLAEAGQRQKQLAGAERQLPAAAELATKVIQLDNQSGTALSYWCIDDGKAEPARFVEPGAATDVDIGLDRQKLVLKLDFAELDPACKALAEKLGPAPPAPKPHTVEIGISGDGGKSNFKMHTLPSTGYTVSPIPVNRQGAGWTDAFAVEVTGNMCKVGRPDNFTPENKSEAARTSADSPSSIIWRHRSPGPTRMRSG